jgi:modulator of FtsH protease
VPPPSQAIAGETYMNDKSPHPHHCGYGISQKSATSVLRNTYWLLALSLLPTVLGAWLGVATGITRRCAAGWG